MKQINDFINFISLEKRDSDNTSINYKDDLIEFFEYEGKSICTLDEIRNYIKYLNDSKYSNATICRKISSLRSFYKFLESNGEIKSSPMNLISNPKKEKKLPKYLNYEDTERLLNSPDTTTDKGIRDALILEMLYSTGVRVSELVNIKMVDINYSERKILIHGKGSKERYTYYGSICEEKLNKYLLVREKLPNSDYLLSNKHGGHLNDRVIRKIIDEYSKKADLKFHISPHTLRHTYATHMLNDGADLKSVGDLLGHENLSTTQIYTHVSNERLRSVYLKCHPRARMK